MIDLRETDPRIIGPDGKLNDYGKRVLEWGIKYGKTVKETIADPYFISAERKYEVTK